MEMVFTMTVVSLKCDGFFFQAIKRDREVHEQARAAEQRLAGSSMDTEQSDISDKNKLPDFFLQPLRCVAIQFFH